MSLLKLKSKTKPLNISKTIIDYDDIQKETLDPINNIKEASSLIIGEGASGGALGIGVGDNIYMLENTWYSVISPESCSSILWRSWEFKEKAAEALKLTAKDMLKAKLIDKIIKEPLGGAHFDRNKIFKEVKNEILNAYEDNKKITSDKLIKNRRNKFISMGSYLE